MFNKKSILLAFASLVSLSLGAAALAAPAWVEQGPGPILNGQDEGLTNNPVAGAINAIVPISADIVFVGTVNGGVWKTSNATAATPTLDAADRYPSAGAVDQLVGGEPG